VEFEIVSEGRFQQLPKLALKDLKIEKKRFVCTLETIQIGYCLKNTCEKLKSNFCCDTQNSDFYADIFIAFERIFLKTRHASQPLLLVDKWYNLKLQVISFKKFHSVGCNFNFKRTLTFAR